MLRWGQQNCQLELPGGRGCLSQRVTQQGGQGRRGDGVRGEAKVTLPTLPGPARAGQGTPLPFVPGCGALPGAAEGRRTGGSAPAHRGRVPARHGPRSTAAPRRNRSDALSHRRACASASRRSLNLSPLPSVLCRLSSAQRGRGSAHHHVAPGSCRPEPGTPESGAGSQSPARVPQLQPPPAAVRGRLSQTAVTTEHSLLYSRTQCPPCQYINFLIALLIN